MKKNYIYSIGICFIIMAGIFFFGNAYAANLGSANVTYTGPSTATVGNEIAMKLNISNIMVDTANIGICGLGGNISFDSNYLEYISATGMTSPYAVQIAPNNNYKIAGIDFTLANGFNTSTDVITLKFRVKKAGNTSLTFTNGQLNDCSNNRLNLNVFPVTISLSDAISKDTNNNLSSLSITGQVISPVFHKDTLSYSLTVANSVTTVTLNATSESSKASVTGTGNKNLSIGNNRFDIVVTSESGDKKTYTVNVTRESMAVSNDNSLKDLTVSGYNLNPIFNKDILKYSLTVPNASNQITVNALKNNDNSTVVITGNTNLQVGNNVVTILVTAEDGSKKTYIINVTKESEETDKPVLDNDATLKQLNISGYTLVPVFNKNINVYSINVGEKVEGLKVDAIANSSKAKVVISGNTGWKYGVNQVSVIVTAEDGSKNTYSINVNRKDPNETEENKKSNDNYLNSISIDGYTLLPTFNRNTSNYNVKVPYQVSSLPLHYTLSNSKAKVEIIGNKDLKVNEINTVEIKITAEDGSIRIYTINVTRTAFSSNNQLKNLQTKDFNLSPNFDSNTYTYNIKVKANTDRLDITAFANNDKAKVVILNNENFKVGNNIVLIKVTDENGFTQIYQINVEKPELTILGMSVGTFLMFSLLGIGLLTVFIILIILLKRKNKDSENSKPVTPIIDFKPEFNFGSKNGTDDDIIYPNGFLNQNGNIHPKEDIIKEVIYEKPKEIPYDPYDDIVTKEEIIDAIQEGLETKNPEKLKMLLEQENLNRKKEELKLKEKNLRRSDRYDEDEWNL